MPPPYGLILADPAWAYRNVKTGGSHTSGSAQKYPVMTLDQIAAMPVKQIAAKSSILALWATTPFGGDPYTVMQTWGFTYKTELYWHKVGRKGTGYWLRGDVEKLLIGIRGHVPAWRHNLSNWVEQQDGQVQAAARELRAHLVEDGAYAILDQIPTKWHAPILTVAEAALSEVTVLQYPVGVHSHKPDVVRDLLRAMTPDVSRVELFATDRAEGFDSYGLELDPQHDFRDPEFWKGLLAMRAEPAAV